MSTIKKEINIFINKRPVIAEVYDMAFEYTLEQYHERCRVFIKIPIGWALLEDYEGPDTIEKVKRYWGINIF